MPFKLYLTCLRPQQWVKNLIIFAAPFTAGSPLKFTDLKQLAVVFIFFCAASSTNYVLNDFYIKFISIFILVPLLIFFSLQRYFVRGLLAGSVK